MLATLKIQPGRIAQQTVVINGELAYNVQLTCLRLGRQPYQLKITAITLLGPTVITQQRFGELKIARATYEADLQDLTQK